MKSFIETLGYSGSDPSIHIFFNLQSYLFDCGEGTGRNIPSRDSLSIPRIKFIFLSSLSWSSIGGLHTFFFNEHLTSGDSSKTTLHVYGPPDVRGKFYPEKAAELGVNEVQGIKLLSKGEPFTNSNGETILPEQVMDPKVLGSYVSIINCPTVEYIESILESKDFEPYFEGEGQQHKLLTVFHHTPHDVFKSEKYGELLNRFGSDVKHILVNGENCEISSSLPESDDLITKIVKIIPNLFPKHWLEEKSNPLIPLHQHTQLSKSITDNIVPVQMLTRVGISPTVDRGVIQHIPLKQYLKKLSSSDSSGEIGLDEGYDFEKTPEGKEIQRSLPGQLAALDSKPNNIEYPKILFTGTGSSVPTDLRNVTGNLITAKPGKYFLLDAGEGTYLQMRRFFGPHEIDTVIKNLDFIWVSHIHADHHLGIPKIIEMRQNYEEKEGIKLNPLVIVGPKELFIWLNKLGELTKLNFSGVEIGKSSNKLDIALNELDIDNILNVPVIHCPNSYGIVLTFKNGYKLTYSGDTRPCEDLVMAGKDTDILIHEATFNDDMIKDAMARKHSTVSEALDVAQRMNSKFTLLTHFSQRYPLSNSQTNESVDAKKSGVSFDLLQLSPNQFPILIGLGSLLHDYFQHQTNRIEKLKSTLSLKIIKKKEPISFIPNSCCGDDEHDIDNNNSHKSEEKNIGNSSVSNYKIGSQKKESIKKPSKIKKDKNNTFFN
eukprot:gene2816-3501_t